MANQDHLDKLRAGVDAWNHWRHDHLHITPDLSGAELTAANLQGANLTAANLRDASLLRADLEEASFDEAITEGCLGCP